MTNKCRCGCGTEVKGIWSKGHCNRRPKKDGIVCMCGCGEVTNPGRNWLSGHNSKSPEDKARKSKMFDRLWKEGKFEGRRVWNEGLTKETDARLAENGRKISATYTEEKRQKYSDRNIKNGIHQPHYSGPANPSWKGGITDIRHLIAGGRLWKEWKLPILKRDGFCCVKCGSHESLRVHHDIETMSSILRKLVPIFDVEPSFEERKRYAAIVVNYHVSNNVSGVTLCCDCHKLEHSTKIETSASYSHDP